VQLNSRDPVATPIVAGIKEFFAVDAERLVTAKAAVVIDFAGPWEVFQDVHDAQGHGLFNLYTVAKTNKPVNASAGLNIVPDYTFETAPAPKVIVIPAQNGESTAMLEWIRKSTKTTDVTMSFCTGAYVLARTGLLSDELLSAFHGSCN
jgi:transcriptional regulator GlxA family with amidase domain